MSSPFIVEIDDPWSYEDAHAIWEAGYTACHNDSIHARVTPNPYEERS